MTRLLTITVTLLLAFSVYMYLEYQDTVEYTKQLMHKAEVQSATINSLNDDLNNITRQTDQLNDRIIELESENRNLKRTPVKVITKTINKNEKVVPISEYASQYYNRILTKRYQNK